jgi:hypothetical protein
MRDGICPPGSFDGSAMTDLLAELAAEVVGQQAEGLGGLEHLVMRPEPAAGDHGRGGFDLALSDSLSDARFCGVEKAGDAAGRQVSR